MSDKVAIVDYGLGNLFSVSMACVAADLDPVVSSSAETLLAAEAVILPGVGAFGDAMAALHRLDLVTVIRDLAEQGKPLLGICLGFQLLMSESDEFGHHRGLGLIEGSVRSLGAPRNGSRSLKVPHVGWNSIERTRDWSGTMLEGVPDHSYMYFVHSYKVLPACPEHVVSSTQYGDVHFCSSISAGSVFGCQFHPERSGPVGLRLYRNLRARIGSRVLKGAACR